MIKGKVWLVGAGPSDAGLFTLKGKALLEKADVVVYDQLVGHGVLAMIPSETRSIYVGKIAGNHPVPQDKINRILLDEAQNGNKVVRLKGGDPFVFGRGGEELELLKENNIPFEVVPGITSAIAVPAYHGIPLTHRDYSSSLHIITGHSKKNNALDIDYDALVRTRGTLVFLMGVTAMETICLELIKAGINPSMPAAVLERGTTAHQRRVVSSVSSLYSDARKANIKAPSIIVIGEVCTLADTLHWAEDRPLGNMKIALTRPLDRASALAEKLELLGAEVVLIPSIETVPITDNVALRDALKNINIYNWIAFTSPVGVKIFFDALHENNVDVRNLAGIKLAAIGLATKRAVEEKGIFVDAMPDVYNGQELGALLSNIVTVNEKVLIPRAKSGTEDLVSELKLANVSFNDIPIYDTNEGETMYQNMYDDSVDYVAFTSASTVRGFVKQNPLVNFVNIQAVCIGSQTAAEAEKHGMQVTISKEATIEGMIDCFLTKGL